MTQAWTMWKHNELHLKFPTSTVSLTLSFAFFAFIISLWDTWNLWKFLLPEQLLSPPSLFLVRASFSLPLLFQLRRYSKVWPTGLSAHSYFRVWRCWREACWHRRASWPAGYSFARDGAPESWSLFCWAAQIPQRILPISHMEAGAWQTALN